MPPHTHARAALRSLWAHDAARELLLPHAAVYRPFFVHGTMEHLWLGYDNLVVRCADVSVVLVYHSALDQHIITAFGRVPSNIQTVVVTSDGLYWPSSWRAEQLRSRLTRWRISDVG